MRRFLICAGVHSQPECLTRIEQEVQKRHADAVLFAGGVLGPMRQYVEKASPWGLGRDDALFIDRFFEVLGRLKVFCAAIPGPLDIPREEFLRLGMHAEIDYPNVHMAHATLLEKEDVALCGVGGCVSVSDSYELEPCSRTMVEYHLRVLWASTRPFKIVLLSFPSAGKLGGSEGQRFVGELIDSYHPELFVAAGTHAARGAHWSAHTLVVNPGHLSEGAALWIDRDKPREHWAELIDFTVDDKVLAT